MIYCNISSAFSFIDFSMLNLFFQLILSKISVDKFQISLSQFFLFQFLTSTLGFPNSIIPIFREQC